MTATTTAAPTNREPELLGQTVVVIGGSSGIGLETARRARAEGADVVLTGLNSDALQRAAIDLRALSTAAFDANDPAGLERFFAGLPTLIDHVMVTAGAPHYGRCSRRSQTSCATPSATASCSPSKPPATPPTGSGQQGRCCS